MDITNFNLEEICLPNSDFETTKNIVKFKDIKKYWFSCPLLDFML